MQIFWQVVVVLLWAFIGLLWVRFVVDWVVLEVVYSVTDPPIKALRRVIPPLRIGSIALDLSFLIVLLGAYVLLRLLSPLAA